MKKAAGILLAGCMVVGLAACGGGKEETTTCTLEQNGVVIEMNLVAKGDKVTKLTQTSTINVEGYAEEQLDMLDATVESAKEAYGEIEGIEYSVETSDSEYVEKVVIPTDKDTLQAVVKAGLLPVDNEDVTELSLEATVSSLEESGWTVKEQKKMNLLPEGKMPGLAGSNPNSSGSFFDNRRTRCKEAPLLQYWKE